MPGRIASGSSVATKRMGSREVGQRARSHSRYHRTGTIRSQRDTFVLHVAIIAPPDVHRYQHSLAAPGNAINPGADRLTMAGIRLEHVPQQRAVRPPAFGNLLEIADQVDIDGRIVFIPQLTIVVGETGVADFRQIEPVAEGSSRPKTYWPVHSGNAGVSP